MGNNLADFIERCILGKFIGCREEYILMRRNDMAVELSCAPSQISYVLSTRFTPERGFVVKSRRGAGGFVYIMRILPAVKEIEEQEQNALDVLVRLFENKVISGREHVLLKLLLGLEEDRQKQFELLKEAFKRMGDFA